MIKKNIIRYPKESKNIHFKVGKNIIAKNKKKFYLKNNIHNIIKLTNTDYRLIKKNMNKLMHFNIQKSDHQPGKNYLIFKIYKKGNFNGRIFKEPILSDNSFIYTKCLSVKNNIQYINLKNKVFKYSLSNVKNINELQKAIKRRYNKSLAHLSNKEKMSLGVGVSELQIIKI